MDSLLKRVNLDLKLVTYGILAVSQNDGIMEFVSGAYQLTHILRTHNDNLADFLRYHNPDENGVMGISAVVFENFIRSTAGYCVITYILGIGDRHLDNLMMNTKGQFFHIDFGFIFGQDPKILPPPFRLTSSMVKSMGGINSEHYAKFKSYCYQDYNWLRKSADLIINLLGLMGDAGLGDISKKSTLEKVLLKVEEKFRLDLTDEEAEHFFSGLINEAQSSMVPKVLEVFHVLSVAMK
jgi:phosphatidylinositol 3-kinase